MKKKYKVFKTDQINIDNFEAIASNYEPLIHKLINPYLKIQKAIYDKDDLQQEALFAIFKAIQTYDPSKLSAFGTFVRNSIKWQLLGFVSGQNAFKVEDGKRNYYPEALYSDDITYQEPVQSEKQEYAELIHAIETIRDVNVRTAMLIYYRDDKYIKDISFVLKKSLSECSKILNDGREYLHHYFAEPKPS